MASIYLLSIGKPPVKLKFILHIKNNRSCPVQFQPATIVIPSGLVVVMANTKRHDSLHLPPDSFFS